jgi:hypothetical protein
MSLVTWILGFMSMCAILGFKFQTVDSGMIITRLNGNLPSEWGISFVFLQFMWLCAFMGWFLYCSMACVGRTEKRSRSSIAKEEREQQVEAILAKENSKNRSHHHKHKIPAYGNE